MVIDINQNKISISAEYSIYVNEVEKYFASKKAFRFLNEVILFNQNEARARYQIKQNWTWLKKSYDLIKYDNNQFKFRTINIWKSHYICQVGKDTYEIFGHRGRKYSIYKNESQIAYWDKEIVTWFDGDNFKMIADENSDIELLICFCLILDISNKNNNSDTTLNIDFGNIGPEEKKFDSNWTPK